MPESKVTMFCFRRDLPWGGYGRKESVGIITGDAGLEWGGVPLCSQLGD